MLKQIQSYALAREQHIGKDGGSGDQLAGFDFFAVTGERFELQLRIERHENFLCGFKTGDHHFFARNEPPFCAGVAHQNRLSRNVAAAEVLAQEQSDAGIQRAFVKPVHDSASSIWSSAELRCAISSTRALSSETFSAGARDTKSELLSCRSNFSASLSLARAARVPAQSRSSLRAGRQSRRRLTKLRAPQPLAFGRCRRSKLRRGLGARSDRRSPQKRIAGLTSPQS